MVTSQVISNPKATWSYLIRSGTMKFSSCCQWTSCKKILKNKTCDMTYHWLEHTWIIHEIDKETSTAGDCNMLNFHSCKTYSMQWYKCPLLPPYYFLDILYIKYMGTSEPETTVDMKSLVCWSPVPYNWGQAVSGVGSRSFCFLELTWQCRYCVRRWRMAFTFFPFFPVLVL